VKLWLLVVAGMSWLGDLASSALDGAQDLLGDAGIDLSCVENAKNRVCDVNGLAKESIEYCVNTLAKSNDMLSFAMEIKDTLDGFKDGMDASDLKTVKELIEGDKMKAAMGLAGEMDDIALTCIEKSLQMTTKMQEGYDGLPGFVKEGVDQVAGEEEDDRDMTVDVEPDISELTECINAVKELNLFTAMEAGMNAFRGLTSKAEVCMNLYEKIKGFAEAVTSITDAMMDLDVQAVISKVKDMCKCIRLTDVMRQFCEQVQRLITFIIDLFKEVSEKLSCLWAALDYAKDCLSDCGAAASAAKDMCVAAFEHGCSLIETCTSIKGQLESVTGMDASAVQAIKDLAGGDDVKRSIDLAQGMDDQILQCTEKVLSMIDTVKQGWDGLPPIVTDGIDDLVEAGKADDDPSPADTERDIADLDSCKGEVDSSSLLNVAQVSMNCFSGVSDKVEVCKSMLETSQGFSDSCNGTISEFMGTWNLDTMGDKIKQICRCVTLGEMMRQFAEQVKNLVMSIVALLQSILDKFTNLPIPDLGSVADGIQDAISDGIEKLKFW